METKTASIKKRFENIAPFLNERMRRLFAAAEASAIGHGGITQVSRATGISRPTIAAGLKELADLDRGWLDTRGGVLVRPCCAACAGC